MFTPSLASRLLPLTAGIALAALGLLPGVAVEPPRAAAAPEPAKPFAFTDVTEAMGLKGNNGGVAAWGDYDNDGWVDVCVGGEVCHNDKGKGFTTVGRVGGPAVWGDHDNDGYLDLFCWQPCELFRHVKRAKCKDFVDR